MPRSKPHAHLYSHKILTAVIDFLCRAGANHEQVRGIVEKRLAVFASSSSSTRGRKAVRGRGDDTVSAAVLHRWHRDRSLIDDDATPKPLRLYGAAPSVEAIVRSEKPESAARTIIADMLALGLLKRARSGKFLPTARVATIGTMHPVLMEHVSKSLVRLLETVQLNTSPDAESVPLIERFTHIPDLPLARVAEFRRFSQEHGSAFLASVDDWLEARRVRNAPKKGRGTAAGIHVYAYVGQQVRSKTRSRAKRA
jgi:hypothetical protein